MIELEHVYKRFGERFAVKDVTLKVPTGQVVGFLGPNGAGKSTTMKMITGLISPTEGQIRVCGRDIFDYPMETKEVVGFLPETPPLYLDMLVTDYLKFVGEIRGVSAKTLRSRVDHVISHCQLDEVRHRLIGNLSKGYKQRVGIAQALIHDPQVIVLDEPTIGLDPAQILEIRQLMRSFSKVRTVILSTHIMQEVTAVCDRVVIINEGQIVADRLLGQTQEHADSKDFMLDVVNWDKDPVSLVKGLSMVTQVFRRDPAGTELFVKLNGAMTDIYPLVEACKERGVIVRSVRPTSLNIEDFYLSVISGQEHAKEMVQ